MAAQDISIKDNIWLYQDKPGNDLTVLTLATGLVSFMVVLFLRVSIEAVVTSILLVTFLSLVVFLAQSKTMSIEIDREKAAVIKTTNYRVFRMSEKHPLGEFDRVQLLTVDQTVEEGYRTVRYPVVLSGKTRSLELLSTDTEGKGKAIQKELAEFLGMAEQQSL